MSALGRVYSKGLGTAVDNAQAFAYYMLAAQRGDSEAQFELGLMFYDGRGVQKDLDRALEWLETASKSGCVGARRTLMYLPEYLERVNKLPQYHTTLKDRPGLKKKGLEIKPGK
jgi:TPR repeat protein